MIGDLHDLDEIEGALEIAEEIAIHALDMRRVEDHANGGMADGADDIASPPRKWFISMPAMARALSRLQAKGQTFVGDPRRRPGEVGNKAIDLHLARRIRIQRRSERRSVVRRAVGRRRSPRLNSRLQTFARARRRRASKAARGSSAGLPQTRQPATRPRSRTRDGDGGLRRRRPGREPRVLHAGKADRRGEVDLRERIAGAGARGKQRRLGRPEAEMGGVSAGSSSRLVSARRQSVPAAPLQEGTASVSRAARHRLVTRCSGTSERQSVPCGRLALRPWMRRGSASTPIGASPVATDFATWIIMR